MTPKRPTTPQAQVSDELLGALKEIRHMWATHAEQCAYVTSGYEKKCDCDWPKIAARCDAAIAKAESALSTPPARDDVAALVEAQMEEEFRALQSVVYKIQMPENQNKFPTEYLNDAEKIAARKAVAQSLARVRDGGK